MRWNLLGPRRHFWNLLGDSASLPSRVASVWSYTIALVRQAVARGTVVVLMRSRKRWVDSVPELVRSNLLELCVPRAPYMTPTNLGAAGFTRVSNALESVP